MHVKINVIAIISCYFERSIVYIEIAQRIFKHNDIHYTSITPDKTL